MAAEDDLLAMTVRLRAAGVRFALATVVRTSASTAAKAGARAIITADGRQTGWLGGSCAEGAVRKAALAALADGRSRLIAIQPQDAAPPPDGIEGHRQGCPSGGTLDVFIEPMLPPPTLLVVGAGPVAQALAAQAPAVGFAVARRARLAPADTVEADTSLDPADKGADIRWIVVATQGRGDLDALQAALASKAPFVAFVGSRRKVAALRVRLGAAGVAPPRLAALRAPAGLDIGAITAEEIALSILAELVQERRRGERAAVSQAAP
jgi:xanthine dehydrogenase accessory factor